MKASERHKLKHDAYADTVYKAAAWAKKNQTQILTVVLVVLVLGIAVMWIVTSRQKREAASRTLLAAIERGAQVSPWQFNFGKEEDRDRLLKDMANQCEQLAADYPASKAAAVGLFRMAELYTRAERWGEAVSYYRRTLTSRGAGDALKRLARRGLAAALEADGKFQDAIVEYMRDAEGYAGEEAARVHWNVGRCYQQLKELDRARESYQKVLDLAGDSVWADLARTGLITLDASAKVPLQTPSPVAPPASDAGLPEKNPLDASPAPEAPTPDEAAPETSEG